MASQGQVIGTPKGLPASFSSRAKMHGVLELTSTGRGGLSVPISFQNWVQLHRVFELKISHRGRTDTREISEQLLIRTFGWRERNYARGSPDVTKLVLNLLRKTDNRCPAFETKLSYPGAPRQVDPLAAASSKGSISYFTFKAK